MSSLPGWLLALLVALPTIAPLVPPGLIGSHRYGDSPFLLVRVIALVDALRAGTLFPRWSPEMAYGLGYPFFNFYGPLAYYGAAILDLAGLPTIDAIKLTQAIAILAAAPAMYWLTGRHLGQAGGVIAAAAYCYAPYHLVNVYARGDSLGELTALAFLPLLLGAIDRAAAGRPIGAVVTAVALAGLILAHNLSALLAVPLVGLWSLIALGAAWRAQGAVPWRGAALVAAGLLIGVGLTTFYWLPVLFDRRYIHLEHNTTGYFDFRNHFLTTAGLIQPNPVYDYGLSGTVDGALPFRLGLVQALLAAAGLALLPLTWRRASLRPLAMFGAVVAGLYVGLAWEGSRRLWELAPTIAIVQFPWRMLGPAGLGLALLAALPVAVLQPRTARVWLLGATAAAILGGGLGAQPERWRIAPDEIDAAGLQRYESLTSSIGSTVRYEYLPIAALERPWTSSYVQRPDDALAAQFASDRGPATAGLAEPAGTGRLAGSSASPALDSFPRPLPGQAAQVLAAQAEGSRFSLLVAAPRPGPFTLEHYFFPGWQAAIDGVATAPRASSPDGYLEVDLPAGEHRLELWFGDTPLRRAARWASLATLAGALAALLATRAWSCRRAAASQAPARRDVASVGRDAGWPTPTPDRIGRWPGIAVAALALGLFVARVDWADLIRTVPVDGWDRRFGDEHAPWPFVVPDGVDLGGTWLRGYRQPVATAGGQSLPLHLWLDGPALTIETRLVAPAEAIVGADRTYASTTRSDATGLVDLALTVPEGTPPGYYQIEIRRADRPARWLLAPLRVMLGAAESSEQPIARFGDQIALLDAGPRPNASAARPSFALRWRADRIPDDDWRVSARLVDRQGRVWGTSDSRPADGFAPTRLWSAGQVTLELRDLPTLVGTPPGEYQIELRLYSLAGRTLDVVDRRGAAIAPFARTASFRLGPGPAPTTIPPRAELAEATIGAREVDAGRSLAISAVWRAAAAPGRDLAVDVAIGGRTQRRPVAPGFPATQWRPGEVVREWYDVAVPADLPAGSQPVEIGLVDAGTGAPIVTRREIGRVDVRQRPRRFDAPTPRAPVGAVFGDAIELIGYDLADSSVAPGGSVDLTLYWRARAPIATSWTVFTHILDRDQRVRGQVDAIPAGGDLPTDGWAPGEIVVDRYRIPLAADAPPGRSEIEVGLYDARSGARLTTRDATGAERDHLILAAIDVIAR